MNTNIIWISHVALVIKNLPANAGDVGMQVPSLDWEDLPWKRKWQPTPIFLPRESPGQLVEYSP